MKILAVGNPEQLAEFKQKFGQQHNSISFSPDHSFSRSTVKSVEVVFDFTIDENPENIEYYADFDNIVLFVNVIKSSLADLYYMSGPFDCAVFGFNGLGSFINRSLLEVSALDDSEKSIAEEKLQQLGTEYAWVSDRVGMISPRIVAMIINEAYYTVQEGTASKADIDQGMKLGTNYPFGPFEWCNKIGISQVYELLEALYEDTKEERYKICPLLKREYQLQ